MITGRYPWAAGFYDMGADTDHCTTNSTALPQLLKPLGYRRHAVGKWCVRVMLAYIPPPRSALSDLCWCRHLGFFKTSYTPTFRDFESFYGYYEGSEE